LPLLDRRMMPSSLCAGCRLGEAAGSSEFGFFRLSPLAAEWCLLDREMDGSGSGDDAGDELADLA
jgi:hypothetical protein